MSHDFHFVLSNMLKEKIINFSSVNNMNYSQTIIYIFNIMKPVFSKHFFIDSKCELILIKDDLKDMNIHVHLEKKDYNFLKQIHSNFQTFSIAKLLRWMLESFFDSLNKYGFHKFKKMMKKYQIFFLRNIKCNLGLNKKISENIRKQTTPKLFSKHMYGRKSDNVHLIIKLCNNYQYLGFNFP